MYPAVQAPYTFGPAPIEGRTDRPTYRAKGLTFRVGADEDPDAAAGGYQVRRQGGEVARERRPAECGVPRTGQLSARTGRPHCPVGGSAATTVSVPRVLDPSRSREGDVRRRSSSKSLGALSATGELRSAQQPPASSDHRDPWVPSCCFLHL